MALQFPADLTDTYYFDLKFVTYSRPNPYSGTINLSAPASFFEGTGAAVDSPGSGSIRLPVPSNLQDTQKLVWVQANNVGGALEAAELGFGGDSAFGSAMTKMGAKILSDVSGTFSGGAIGDPMAYVLQKSGLALNPVLTQMFKNPEFKEHAFSWTLAPATAGESSILQSIVDTIKEQSLPGESFGGAFFSYPSIAMIRIHTGANGDLYNFQPAVITSVTANYAPKGVPSFFAGTNAPTEIKLDISLVEIILNTRKNFKGGNVSGFDFSFGGVNGSTSINPRLQQSLSKVLNG